jgi:hypothetical protein
MITHRLIWVRKQDGSYKSDAGVVRREGKMWHGQRSILGLCPHKTNTACWCNALLEDDWFRQIAKGNRVA